MCAAHDMLRGKKLKVRGSGKEKNPEMYPILGDFGLLHFSGRFPRI